MIECYWHMHSANSSARVLVVDDDPMIRRFVTTALSTSGYDVVDAGDAEDAMARREADPAIRLILTDVVMPRVDGFELARQMRARWPDLKILFMSGHVPGSLGDDLADSTMIMKPFRVEELLSQVARTLDAPPPAAATRAASASSSSSSRFSAQPVTAGRLNPRTSI